MRFMRADRVNLIKPGYYYDSRKCSEVVVTVSIIYHREEVKRNVESVNSLLSKFSFYKQDIIYMC